MGQLAGILRAVVFKTTGDLGNRAGALGERIAGGTPWPEIPAGVSLIRRHVGDRSEAARTHCLLYLTHSLLHYYLYRVPSYQWWIFHWT
jgi:hypothetical protein